MYLIYKHLFRSVMGPFGFGLFIITFVLMIDNLFKYIDLFVSKGVPFLVATEVLALSLGHTFALSVPMAVLVGVLMGLGQLSADNEITALKASGVGLYHVLIPLLLWSGLVGVGLTAYNHFVFPEFNHRLANLVYDISRSRPMMEVRENMFTELSDRITIHVQKKDDRTGRIEGVTIIERGPREDLSPRLTTAEWGVLVPLHDSNALRIELHDGEIHDFPDANDPAEYQVIRFTRHDLLLRDLERDLQSSDRTHRGDREMNVIELLARARDEKHHQEGVRRNVDKLVTGLLTRQFALLDPQERAAALGWQTTDPAPAGEDLRRGRHVAVQQKVALTADEIANQGKVLQSYVAKANRYMVEVHKKFAIPGACLVFVLLGIPLAVTTGRSGRGASVSAALAIYLIYYLFLIGGEKLSDKGRLDPFLAMWAANILLTVVGIPIFLRTVRESSLFHFTLRTHARQTSPSSLPPSAPEVPAR
jgi:lipopolysaccharide export system permease protein